MTTVEPVRRFLEAAQSGDRRIIEEYIDGSVQLNVFIVKQHGICFVFFLLSFKSNQVELVRKRK